MGDSVNSRLTNIANAIRQYTNFFGDSKLSLSQMAIGVHKVYNAGYDPGWSDGRESGIKDGIEQGKQAEYDRFWDNYQENGNRTNYRYAFNGAGWSDETFQPKYRPIVLSGNVYDIFASSKVSYVDESLVDCSKATIIQYFLSSNTSAKPVTVIMDVSSCTMLQNTFIYSANLETVELKNIREDCKFPNTFTACSGLVNFRCTGTIGTEIDLMYTNNLSDESVQNIIDHLADLTGKQQQVVSFSSSVLQKLTDEQIAAMVAKNWNY